MIFGRVRRGIYISVKYLANGFNLDDSVDYLGTFEDYEELPSCTSSATLVLKTLSVHSLFRKDQ